MIKINNPPWSPADSATLASDFLLQTVTAGLYENTGLSVPLPGPGLWRVNVDVRYAFSLSTGTQMYMVAKLVNSTDAADVANSVRTLGLTGNPLIGVFGTAPITKFIRTTAAKTIQLHAAWFDATTVTFAAIASSSTVGRTEMFYERISA